MTVYGLDLARTEPDITEVRQWYNGDVRNTVVELVAPSQRHRPVRQVQLWDRDIVRAQNAAAYVRRVVLAAMEPITREREARQWAVLE